MGAAHSGGEPSTDSASKRQQPRRRRHSVDSVASYSSQNHVDRIRTQNFSAASCQEESDFSSVKSRNLRRSSLEFPHKRPESVTSNTSSTRSRLRELVERKSQDEQKPAASAVGDLQYLGNPAETLEFDSQRSAHDKKGSDERPKKKKLTKGKDKDKDAPEGKSKKHEKYQSKLAEYYLVPPQDEFYQHLTRSGGHLRRSRSLAVIREESAELPQHRRSQLIPRARLFDKPCFKDRLPGRTKYQTKEDAIEGIYIDSTASCFGEINRQKDDDDNNIDIIDIKSDKEEVLSRKESIRSRSITGSWPNLSDDNFKQINLSEDSVGHSRNPSEIDSLDSNYVRKHYNFEAHLKSNYKDSSPDTERSSETPTQNKQIYTTSESKNIDEIPIEKVDKTKDRLETDLANNYVIQIENKPDLKSITKPNDIDHYDEISITSNGYELTENICNQNFTKPTEVISKEIDIQSLQSDNDENISSPPDSITSYISISIPSSADKSHKLEYLANSLAEKIDEYCDSKFNEDVSVTTQNISIKDNCSEVESNPIYTRVSKKRTFAETKKDNLSSSTNIFYTDSQIKPNDLYISNTYIERDEFDTENNYHYCSSSKNITTEPFVTTLIENQYYSLPDINISKSLRRSERIDAQLREEDIEDIPCENSYEIAQSHFREILTSKASHNYGQLNTVKQTPKISQEPQEYSFHTEPHLIQNFTRLEDDLKSIITVNSSNIDEKDFTDPVDTQQNEREINEIEGTIRNNKVITKSESLKLSAGYRFKENHIYSSISNDGINQISKEKKPKTGIRKHYSLRQREPSGGDIDRLPSPATVERTLHKSKEKIKPAGFDIDKTKNKSLLSRVQSFNACAETNISIVPLSGHQTIVINAPLDTESKKENNESKTITKDIVQSINRDEYNTSNSKLTKDSRVSENVKKPNLTLVDTSSYCTPKDSFITIKLNKVVKTTIPKLKKETREKVSFVQHKFEKPPPRLIIKDNKNINLLPVNNNHINMTRPQVMQVVDSKNVKPKSEITDGNICKDTNNSEKLNEKSVSEEKPENISLKINNAIKTDMEYQEKLHSVKNYWSKLIENTPDLKKDKHDIKENVDNNDKSIVKDDASTEENMSLLDTTVGSIIKSMESVKIVDSIRKISQTKFKLWKDESEKVKDDSEIDEPLVRKIVKDCEEQISNEKLKSEKVNKKTELELCARDTPDIEIVELRSDDNQNQKTQATLIKAKGYEKGCDDFDHVRYKVMKSELFKNSMIANYRKEAQFDGLLQYLQDYSFQELLVNNNIVIIEPVRTKIEPAPRKNYHSNTCKISPALLKQNDSNSTHIERSKNAIRKHFFYHPIRVNKEIIEEELPNPDTVKKVRNLFEDTLKMKSPMMHDPPLIDDRTGLTRRAASHRNLNEDAKGLKIGCRKKVIRQLTIDTSYGNKKWDNASLSSGVSSGDLSSNNDYETGGLSPFQHKNLKDHVYSSSSEEYLCDSVSHDFCCESQYVSPDILKKIRECGTSITYYGGKVLNSKMGSMVSPMTKAIMEEIKILQKNCSRDCYLCQTKCRGDRCSCLIADNHKPKQVDIKQHSSTSSDSGNHDPDKTVKRVDSFPGFKFKLVKSNSCSSRLELAGTDDGKDLRNKYRKYQEDPPLVNEDENSVKNKICRLESYKKGIVNTPFESEEEQRKTLDKKIFEDNKLKDTPPLSKIIITQDMTTNKPVSILKKPTAEKLEDRSSIEKNDSHCFEKKFYYVNDNLQENKTKTGRFGEMVFEEFEVLETCYDSLNSNKPSK